MHPIKKKKKERKKKERKKKKKQEKERKKERKGRNRKVRKKKKIKKKKKTITGDCFAKVPAYYTDRQRHAILNASEIAGLNCIRLLNESTSAVLSLGITRASEFPENDPKNMVFVDIGHTAMTVTIASFTKDKAIIKATTFDRTIGGRVFDEILAKHYAEKIKVKEEKN